MQWVQKDNFLFLESNNYNELNVVKIGPFRHVSNESKVANCVIHDKQAGKYRLCYLYQHEQGTKYKIKCSPNNKYALSNKVENFFIYGQFKN